jgi:signal transduction histidine kinase
MTGQPLPDDVAALRRRVEELDACYRAAQLRVEEERERRAEQQQAFERQHGFVRLLQAVAAAANEAPSVAAALRITLDQVCSYMGWPVGHALVRDRSGDGRLAAGGPWHLDAPERYVAFRRATDAQAFERGRGLPGMVLQHKGAVWLPDLAHEPHGSRAVAGAEAGLLGGFALPVLVREDVAAVLEFFAAQAIPRDEELTELARYVGTQLGRVLERKYSEDALRHTRARQQALSRRLLEFQELERSRIARELHDQIGQALTAVKLNLEAAQQGALGETEMAEALAAVDQAIEQVRTLSFELRPALLDDLGLVVAVSSYAKRQAAKAGFELDLDLGAITLPIRKEVETACFRILQEALTNVVRHARARRIRVALHEADGVLDLTVRDDGAGFALDARERGGATHGLGLLGMRERAQNVGGVFHVQSSRGGGTLVRARLPQRASQRLERRGAARS